MNEYTIIKLSDYGAFPNDGKESGDAIRRAIKEAGSTKEKVIVEFEPGVYHINSIDPDAPERSYFPMCFDGLTNVEIRGNGATIMMDNPFLSGFRFSGGGDISIDGISIDYAIDPWAQGEVVSVNKEAGTFEFKVNNLRNGISVLDYEDCWAVLHRRSETVPFGMVKDDEDPLLFKKGLRNYFFGCRKATKISDGLYTIEVAKEINGNHNETIDMLGRDIVEGSKLVLNCRINSTGVFSFGCQKGDISVTNCNVYASIGTISIMGGVVGNVTYDNVKVLATKGRWTTSNADGFFSIGIRGKLSITNCVWEGISDDYLNLFVVGYDITDIKDDNITIRCTQENLPLKGDRVTVLDPSTGTIRQVAKVAYVEQISPLAELGHFVSAVIKLDEDIKSIKANNDVVINREWQAPGTTIENNIFKYGRNKCLKINLIDPSIKGNTFENIPLDAIVLHDYNFQFKEHGCVENCIIENNTFKNCAYLKDRKHNTCSTITVFGTKSAIGCEGEGYIHSNIKILNNEITNVYRSGIYLSNAKDVTISGNKINGVATDDAITNIGILLNTVENVKIDGNTITDLQNLPDSSGIKILENAGENITCTDNVFNLADGVVQIDDQRN